jgi:small subunit ribosomal protein S4
LTGLNLLHTLETRLDNVVYRMASRESRSQARQLVNHGHLLVNNIRADIPSMLMKAGDIITVRESSRGLVYFKELPDLAAKRNCAMWLDRDLKSLSGRVLRIPERSEIDGNLNEH